MKVKERRGTVQVERQQKGHAKKILYDPQLLPFAIRTPEI